MMDMDSYLLLESDEQVMFERALVREEWTLAALCILLGAVRRIRSLSPDAMESLLDELDAAVPVHHRETPRRRRDGHAW
jgi:hypothetical protein